MTASLIERVESADVGSTYFDALIYSHLNCTLIPSLAGGSANRRRWPDGTVTRQRKVSTSLDAALALAERLGWRLYYLDASTIGRPSVMLQSVDDRPGTDPETGARLFGKDFASNSGRSHALALCAAILKAHEASK